MKKVFIMSAKFSPGHFSHMLAYYKLFEELDYQPYLFVDNRYNSFLRDYKEFQSIIINTSFDVIPDILLIYNLSSKDMKYVKQLKRKNANLKVYFVYHEPWYGFKRWICDVIKHNESVIDNIKALGRFIFSKSVIKNANKVILSSNKAVDFYVKNCIKYNKNYVLFPLVFIDESIDNNTSLIKEKKYFSFISTAAAAKNFDLFIKYIKYRSRKDKDALFQIATRTDISRYIDSEIKSLIDNNRLIVIHGHSLTNDEINYAYAISCCTWMLYRRSTQSGVLCKAMMFGSPVIASDIGSFKEFVDGSNGIVLSQNYSFQDIDNAYGSIMSELESFSQNARKTFLNKFLYVNQIERFRKNVLSNDT